MNDTTDMGGTIRYGVGWDILFKKIQQKKFKQI